MFLDKILILFSQNLAKFKISTTKFENDIKIDFLDKIKVCFPKTRTPVRENVLLKKNRAIKALSFGYWIYFHTNN